MQATTPAPTWTDATATALRVAHEVLLHGPLSRADLARRFDLTPSTLTRLTKPLLDDGLLVEAEAVPADPADPRIGRPSQPLDVALGGHRFVGVKVTGDHAFAVATTLRAEVVAQADADLPDHEVGTVLDLVERLVRELAPDGVAALAGVGVAIGGHVTDGIARRAPFLGWAGVDLQGLLRERLRRDVVVENDVVAVTEATHWFGEARGYERFALVTVGAGVGYGLVVHGRLVTSPDVGVGLVGHYPLDPMGPLCPEGHRGCAAALLTTDPIVRAVSAAHGRTLGWQDVLDLAGAGDGAARRVVDDAGHALGRLVAAVANLTMPQVVVVGGEGSGLAVVAEQAVRAGIAQDRDPMASPVVLVVQRGGLAEWARGAAVVAIQEFTRAR